MYTYQTEENIGAERERLILEHLPQVRSLRAALRAFARKRQPRRFDLYRCDRLIAAVDHFDPAQGVQLKT